MLVQEVPLGEMDMFHITVCARSPVPPGTTTLLLGQGTGADLQRGIMFLCHQQLL